MEEIRDRLASRLQGSDVAVGEEITFQISRNNCRLTAVESLSPDGTTNVRLSLAPEPHYVLPQ